MDAAHASGDLSRPLRDNTVFDRFDNTDMTPILRDLIIEASKPLASVETTFAVDSSGFGTSRFARWYDETYGDIRQECGWIKCHLMCGTASNVVTAVEILDKHAGDSPQLPALLDTTAATFAVKEVSADSAYSGTANLEAVVAAGATPYIAFKEDTTGGIGGIFGKCFHYYQFNRDEFLGHYHKRSNVESTFSMIKAKFGDHLRSKSDVAMVNEALCKILCHNICCLIHSIFELGIQAKFWGEAEIEGEPEQGAEGALEDGTGDDGIEALAWV